PGEGRPVSPGRGVRRPGVEGLRRGAVRRSLSGKIAGDVRSGGMRPLTAPAVLVVLASLISTPALAQITCSTDAQCPWSSCQSGSGAQPLGLSHIAEVQIDAAEVLTPLVDAAARNLRDTGTQNLCSIPEFDCPTAIAPSLAGQKCTLNRVTFPSTDKVNLVWA